MKITKLHIVNFLKLKDVEMNPSKTNVIVGKNKQGKTSIIKALQAAFDGKLDPSAIHVGADKAEITVELDEVTIRRSLTEKGAYLDISNKDGFKMPSPQKFLDGILGSFAFNPIDFFNMKPEEQRQSLLEAVKMKITGEELVAMVPELQGLQLPEVNYDAHALEVVEGVCKQFYQQRTVANAEVTKKRKTLDDTLASIPEGFDPSKVSDEHIENLRKAIETDKLTREKAQAHEREYKQLGKDVEDLEEQIRSLTAKRDEKVAKMEEMAKVEFDLSDDTTIEAAEVSLKNLEAQRQHVYSFKRAEELRGELSNAMTTAEKLDAIVKKLQKDVPAALVSKVQLPVEGLAITENGIMVGDIAIENLSASEQLRFALAITRALNDKFKVICIDGVELLDKENFELFLKEIESDDYQYFVTRVDGTGENVIEIEDGAIKA
jgi:hypothetical protein